ncbi:MAG: CHASE2 domain-containing protein, partial [Proteobacteria bacterium]|nr:CHASE2 domain-containing protein [Pseudomonadota bacterium]
MKKGFWTSDWFFGLVFSVLFFILAFAVYADSFSRLETFAYDLGLRSSNAEPSDRIAIIEIDDASIETIGRWPWPRYLHAEMIDRLAEADAKVIATTVLFSEPQLDPGLLYIEDLAAFYDNSTLGQFAPRNVTPDTTEETDARAGAENGDEAATVGSPAGDSTVTPQASDNVPETSVTEEADNETLEEPAPQPPAELLSDLAALRDRMGDAAAALDTDTQLAESIATAGNVVLPFTLNQPSPIGRPDTDLPDWMLANAVSGSGSSAVRYGAIQPP